ncbi:MAG: hypothetical protein P4L90_06530 [Rhodopila sp.]|nr:hypothetical protein [Rhodopila sp.]
MSTKLSVAFLPLTLVACGIFPKQPDNSGTAVLTIPGGTISISCANIVSFQNQSASLNGGKLTLPIKTLGGTPELDLPTLKDDETTSRQASELIETLDNAQVMYCKGMLLAAPEDRYNIIPDYNTILTALSTLLRNITTASTDSQVKAAVVTAASLASTSTSAANRPPPPASPAVVATVAPQAAANPAAAQIATNDISRAASKVATVATAVASTLNDSPANSGY